MHAIDHESQRERIRAAAQFVRSRVSRPPTVGMLLGTGHASFSERLKARTTILGADIPGYPTRHGVDVGSFIVGEMGRHSIIVADAPLSAHEGFLPGDLAFPVWLLKALGIELLVLTAGAASLTEQLEPGDLALVEDHINFAGISPIMGLRDESLGPRFPDMTQPYSREWRRRALKVCEEANFPCREGVLAFIAGPSMPTRAEYRFLRNAGASLVAMSIVPEVVAAVHAGVPVMAILGVLQSIDTADPRPASVEQMLDAAELAAPRVATLLTGLMEGTGA